VTRCRALPDSARTTGAAAGRARSVIAQRTSLAISKTASVMTPMTASVPTQKPALKIPSIAWHPVSVVESAAAASALGGSFGALRPLSLCFVVFGMRPPFTRKSLRTPRQAHRPKRPTLDRSLCEAAVERYATRHVLSAATWSGRTERRLLAQLASRVLRWDESHTQENRGP